MQRALSPVLVGREHELGALEDILLAASRGDARVGIVAGEAGMGKTRLATELMLRARKIGFEVLTGACSEAELSLPYLPFVEAVGNYLAHSDLEALKVRLGPSARELGRLFPRLGHDELQVDAGDPAHARLRLCEALADLLNVPAERRGLLLVLEDLHWADASTREVLDFLVRRLRTGRVMILGTYRSDEMHRKHPLLPTVQGWIRSGLVEAVDLAPLTPDGVRGMVRAIFDQANVSDEFRDFLHNRCEGNPFVLEEMLKLAIDRGEIYRTDAGWERKDLRELRMPRSVKDTILMRVERLDEDQIQLLGTAAVLGQSFDAALLTAASGQGGEAVEDVLHAAEQQQIIEEESAGGRYRFRHALTREVIYEDLPAPKRERLHLRAAAVLRARPNFVAVDVVRHLMAANAFAEAVPLCLQAAREAQRLGADSAAAELFKRALPHIVGERERAGVLCELGSACMQSGEAASAVDYLVAGIELFEQLGDPMTAARYRIDLGRARGLRGHGIRERQEIELAARTLEPGGPSEPLARAYMRLGAIHTFNFEFAAALEMTEKASTVAEGAGADAVRIWNYNFLGLALIGLGRTEAGFESLWRSYREALDKDLRWIAGNALHNISAMYEWQGPLRAREAQEINVKLRDLRVGIWSVTSPLLTDASSYYFLGESDAGIGSALKAIEVGSASGNLWVVRFAEINLTFLYTDTGRLDEALPLLGMAGEELQRTAQEASAIIRYSLATGDIERALDAGRFLLERAVGAVPFGLELAVQAFIAGGALDEARQLIRGFDRQPWLSETPFALRARARLEIADGDHAAGAVHASRALESFTAAGYRPDAARTLLVLASAVADKDPTMAQANIREAARIAEEVGYTTILREAESAMRALGGELAKAEAPSRDVSEESAPGERLVTVLFADVRGYTAITGAIAPSDLADRVAALQRWATSEVARHHGLVDKFAGDAMMATFNVSGSTMDHAVHALQTGLALRDKAAMLGLPLGLGMATGAAVVGRMARGANLSVLGETTNLASRLQSQAGPGEIVLSDEAHRRVAAWLADRTIPVEPTTMTLKGIEGETVAFRLPAPAEVAPA